MSPWYDVDSGLPGTDTPPVVAIDGQLPNGTYDGEIGIARIGTFPGVHVERFAWSDADNRWIGTREHVMISQADTWGMDHSNRALADFRNVWSSFFSPLPYGKAHSALRGDVTFPVASVPLYDVVSSEFDDAGQLRVRNQLITYTGRNTGTHDLTGATGGAGTFPDGTIVTQATDELGGWGYTVAPLDYVDTLWGHGYRLQEKVNAWLNGGQDLVSMSVAPYYYNSDIGADWTLPAIYEAGPPSGGLGIGAIITGPADPKMPVGFDNVPEERGTERDFEYTTTEWTDWVAPAPTGRVLYARLYGRMNSAVAEDNGEVYGYTLRQRWVLDPT